MPEQGGALGAHRGEPGDQLTGVVGIPAGTAGDRRPEQPFAEVAVGQRGQCGLSGGQHQREEIPAGAPAGLGGPRCGGDRVRREPVQLGRGVDNDGGGVHVGEQPAAESGGQRRQLGVERTQPFLLRRGQAGAGADGVAVPMFEQAQRLRIQLQIVPCGEEGVEPGEQVRVQGDRVGVRGQLRRDPHLDLLDAWGGQRADERREHRPDPPQGGAGALQCHHGVVERGRPSASGDRRDLGAVLGHADRERLLQVLLVDRGEVREAERQSAGHQERVHASSRTSRAARRRMTTPTPRPPSSTSASAIHEKSCSHRSAAMPT